MENETTLNETTSQNEQNNANVQKIDLNEVKIEKGKQELEQIVNDTLNDPNFNKNNFEYVKSHLGTLKNEYGINVEIKEDENLTKN